MLAMPICMLAQPINNSPYSRFGIGDVADRNFFASRNMGGLGASFTDPYQINIVNPAALSYLNATTFDIGIYAENKGIRDGVTDQNPVAGPYQTLWSGNLSYISLAIPLQNRVNDLLDRKRRDFASSTAFSLMPFSTVGYNIATTEAVENIGDVTRNFEGQGGTYQFLWSNGFRYKNLSFGLNLGYLFGKIEYARIVQFEFEEPFFNTIVTDANRVSGFLYDFGFLYSIDLGRADPDDQTQEPRKLNIGLHGRSNTSFTSRYIETVGSVQNGTGIENVLSISDEQSFDGTLPAEFGLGLSYYAGQNFGLGVNFKNTQWSNFDANFVNNSLNNTSSLSFGGFIRPNYKSISNYLERIYYRFGFYYNQVPNAISDELGNSIEDIGITFGFGMPFFYQRKISHANLGFSLGLRGQGTAIEERYFRLTFSFSFNDDEWFIKRKYN